MNQQVVKIKKLREDAIIPVYGSEYSAGADLYACIDETVKIKKGETAFISTGLSMEIPDGLVGLLFARSSLGCKRGLAPANKVGVIDSDYRGEIVVALHNHSKEEQVIEKNDKEHLGVLNRVRRTATAHQRCKFLIARIILVIVSVRLLGAPRQLTEVLLTNGLPIPSIKPLRQVGILAICHLHKFMFRRLDAKDP